MSPRSIRFALPCALTFGMFAAVDAQDNETRVAGFVYEDGSGEPLEGALVVLKDGAETYTDSKGRFILRDVRPGENSIAAITQGCRATAGDFEVDEGQDKILKLLIAATPEAKREKERATSGLVITAKQLAKSAAATLLDAIRDHAPGIVRESALGGGTTLMMRGQSSIYARTEPFLMLDGVRVETRVVEFLRSMEPNAAARVEIMPGATAGWQYGPDAANGVIAITSTGAAAVIDQNRLQDVPPELCQVAWKR